MKANNRRFFFYLLNGVFSMVFMMTFGTWFGWPWSSINWILVFLTLYILHEDNQHALFIAMVVYFFAESASDQPFGVQLTAGGVSLLSSLGLYTHFFTDRSWYTAAAVSSLAVVVYRVTQFLLTVFMAPSPQISPWFGWETYASELLLTTFLTTVIYVLGQWRRGQPRVRSFRVFSI